MEKRLAIITGATRGIGKSLSLRLAKEGVNIATLYHQDEASAEEWKNLAGQEGIEPFIEKVDVADLKELAKFVDRVHRCFGRIDYLVNNVGTDIAATVHDIAPEEWHRSQDILLNAPFYLSKAVLPHMRDRRFGRIVNIGASSKDYCKGAAGLGPFGVHKAALSILTKTLALEEIQNGITVNMVAPGSTQGAGVNPEDKRIPISQIPIGRRVEPEEVVEAVLYFLSDKAGATTGQFLGVNGGLST